MPVCYKGPIVAMVQPLSQTEPAVSLKKKR